MSKLALMFPGQGSQAVGMGCDLCAAYPQMRDSYAEASDVLDFDLEQVCAMGPAETLLRRGHNSHLVRHEPHVNPAPNPAINNMSPFFRRPFWLASCRQIGMEAHDVLP